MKKFLLGAFILLDLVLIVGGTFVLYTYVSHRTAGSMPLPPVAAPSPGAALTPPSGAVAASTTGAPSGLAPTTQGKIFSYRNSHARRVAIRADFTGWKAEPMQRDAAGVWTYKAILSPGEYAYCYSVDDKPPLKDPVNKRTKVIGRAVVSAIVVEPPPVKPLN